MNTRSSIATAESLDAEGHTSEAQAILDQALARAASDSETWRGQTREA